MTSLIMSAPDSTSLAEQVAEAVRAHPSVLRLAGGSVDVTGGFEVISTPLPGRRVTGVRVPDTGEPVEIAVVLRLDRPLTNTVADLRERAAAVAGQRPVDVTVVDVVIEDATVNNDDSDNTRPDGSGTP